MSQLCVEGHEASLIYLQTFLGIGREKAVFCSLLHFPTTLFYENKEMAKHTDPQIKQSFVRFEGCVDSKKGSWSGILLDKL